MKRPSQSPTFAAAFALLAAAPAVLAQRSHIVPEGGVMARIAAWNVPRVLEQMPNTRAGRIFADPDVAPAARTIYQHFTGLFEQTHAVMRAARTRDFDLEGWQAANLVHSDMPSFTEFFLVPMEEVQSAVFEVSPLADREANGIGPNNMTMTLTCRPRFEGRWTQRFERDAKEMASFRYLQKLPDAKIDGNPAHAFKAREDQVDTQWLGQSGLHRWKLHLPGSFVSGSGAPETAGRTASTPPPDHAGFALTMNLAAYVEMFDTAPSSMPNDFRAIGLDKLKSLDWRIGIDGELLLDQLTLTTNGETGGLVRVLTGGTGELPAQPLPKGAMLQVRAAIDVAALIGLLPDLDLPDLPSELLEPLESALDGGVAIGCCAPKAGGFMPRIFVTLGIRDEKALQGVLDQLLPKQGNLATKQVTYDGVPCTSLTIPDMPQGVRPTWCVLDGKLHIAESGRSLRSLLKALKTDAVAMDVGDAPLPKGPGEIVDRLDLRCDEAQIYESFYELWLPLFEFSVSESKMAPIHRDDMPEPEVLGEYLGKSRGVLRRDGDVWRVQHLGTLGGPELLALAFTFGPMIGSQMTDYRATQMLRVLAMEKFDTAWEAIDRFKKRESRWPKDLAELFAAEKLAPDLLLQPGDTSPETFTLPDGTQGRTSFRYFPEPVQFEGHATLLIAIKPVRWNRAIMTTQGESPETYGEANHQDVNRFGKGGKSSVRTEQGG